LRAHVAIEDVTDQFGIQYSPHTFMGGLPDPRFPDGALGWRKISPLAEALAAPDGDAAFDARRFAVGVPDLARDAAPEEVFALEALLEELHGVDFNKGCFVGQENVSRMKRRATTRKKFCPIVFEGPALPFGSMVTAGEIGIGTARTSQLGRAMALLRLDRAREALANGVGLTVEGRGVRLDPPPWLLMPTREQI
jgi:folate-binding protein YgfZ